MPRHPGCRIDRDPRQRNDRSGWMRIPGRHNDGYILRRCAFLQIEVMIHELTPGGHHARKGRPLNLHRRVHGASRHHDIADFPRIGPRLHSSETVGKTRWSKPGKVGSGLIERQIREIVARSVDTSKLNRGVGVMIVMMMMMARHGMSSYHTISG
jgi:hypothetical protein